MVKVLDRVDSPEDVKRLTSDELKGLASEIREELVSTIGTNGGHLASSLGVVELTVALHRVFSSPRDKIVWDVGHQCYAHKLLTGRKDKFTTIRQFGGLSGFTDRSESPHDHFGTGHASTSVSAALGMAIARDLAGDDYNVVAIIGDGALTGGMAFEALNQAGHLGTRLIVILNDNGMAISPNVGALSKLLGRVRFSPRYYRTKEEAQHVLARLPMGNQMWRVGKRAKESFKSLIIPTMIWEELGFTYLGPIDGHDIAELEEALDRAKKYPQRPTFVHVITKKGKGYKPAEENPVGFHSLSPVRKGGQAPSYSEVFGRTVLRLARDNPRVVAITAAMPEGTGLNIVAREFPERVFDVGLCEQHAVTFAAGLATQGFIPFVAIYSTFLQRAFDQVIHDVCIQNLPVIFAIDRAGIVGEDGKTHQGTFDLSYLGLLPNMVIASPKDENELQHFLYTAMMANRPMAIRYPKGSGLGVHLDEGLYELPIGRGEVLREGGDVALIAVGSTVAPSLEAAHRLSGEGVESTVINARFAKPLDSSPILEAAGRTGRVVTIEEGSLWGGFGTSVLALLEDSGQHDVRITRIGLPDEFIEHGQRSLLQKKYRIDAEGIAERIIESFPEFTRHPLMEAKR